MAQMIPNIISRRQTRWIFSVELVGIVGAQLVPENIVDYMLVFETFWRVVEKLMRAIFNTLNGEEFRNLIPKSQKTAAMKGSTLKTLY